MKGKKRKKTQPVLNSPRPSVKLLKYQAFVYIFNMKTRKWIGFHVAFIGEFSWFSNINTIALGLIWVANPIRCFIFAWKEYFIRLLIRFLFLFYFCSLLLLLLLVGWYAILLWILMIKQMYLYLRIAAEPNGKFIFVLPKKIIIV